MLALYIIGGIFVYFVMIGAMAPTLIKFLYDGPPNFRYLNDARFLGIIGSIIWPLTFPIGIGYSILTRFDSDSRDERREDKREREIEEAKHRIQLANLAAEEVAAKENAAGIGGN